MAKTEATRRSKRRSKVVTSKAVEEEENVNTEEQPDAVSPSEETVRTEEDASKEDQEEQDSQMEAVIEVKGSTTTVAVTWDQKNEEEREVDDTEKTTDASDQIMDSEEQIVSSADSGGSTQDAPSESTETKMEQEVQESEEPQADIVAGSTASVTVTYEKKDEEGENDQEVQEDTKEVEEVVVKKTPVKGKRKAPADVETSPSKKTKLISDGFCLYVGNLNNFKPFEEVKDTLATYFMTQNLLVQDIRLDPSRKHAHVDLASEMDLTKALTLDGEMVNDKPMKIAKAKVKNVEDKQDAKNARCLFLKNVPYNAKKEDILKVFRKAIDVRFPNETKGPKKGIAFVEFKNKTIAEKVRQQKQGVKIHDRILIVDSVGGTKAPKVTEDSDDKEDTKAAAPQKNTLFVGNLTFNVQEKHLKKVFQKAVNIIIPQRQGKARGFAFVEFASVAEAAKALKSSKDIKICNKPAKVQLCTTQGKSGAANVLSKTLIVLGLAEKTTAETLKSAFEGSFRAKVVTDKDTGVSRRFGFVDFASEDDCKAIKAAMEDCEIDGSKVTVAYARPKGVKGPAKSPRATKGKGGKGGRGGKGRGVGKPQDAAKEVEN